MWRTSPEIGRVVGAALGAGGGEEGGEDGGRLGGEEGVAGEVEYRESRGEGGFISSSRTGRKGKRYVKERRGDRRGNGHWRMGRYDYNIRVGEYGDVQETSQTATIDPAEDDLQPETRTCGSTGENASAAIPLSPTPPMFRKI